MVVLDYEINLSLREYLYFQECPQKFRIYRLLNPIPTKEGFLQAKSSIERYQLREYHEREFEGIKKHQFFASFHQNYEQELTSNTIPQEILQDSELLLFWEYQRKRYSDCIDEFQWKPLYTELPAMTKKQRGIIDSLEFINSSGDLRLIDFKKNKHEKDKESIYFYAVLLEDFIIEQNWDFQIKEIGCYYYGDGVLSAEKASTEKKEKIKKKINFVLEEISNEMFIQNKESCINCSFKMICKIECYRRP